jgi:hypothetical protein
MTWLILRGLRTDDRGGVARVVTVVGQLAGH